MPRLSRLHHSGIKMRRNHCDCLSERKRGADYTIFVEPGQHIEQMCTEFHGITDHNPGHLRYAVDYSRTGLEKRSTSSSLFTFSQFQNAMESSHFYNSDFMVDFTASPITLGSGSSRSCKRKFCFTDDTRSVRPCTSFGHTRFSRRLGGTRVDSLTQVLISPSSAVCDWPHYSDGIILPPHLDALSPLQNKLPHQNRERSATLPIVTWRRRRVLESERLSESGGVFGLRNSLLANQLNDLSSAVRFGCRTFPRACIIHPSCIKTLRDFYLESYAVGFGCRTFPRACIIHPSCIKTLRDFYLESYAGIYIRRFYVNGAETSTANGRMPDLLHPSRRSMLHRAGRISPFRDFASRSSQPAPSEALRTSIRPTSEPEVVLIGNNLPFVSVHGRERSPSISYNNENGDATPRSAPFRRSRQRRRQRVIHQSRSSHELMNQSLENDEADIDSPHSDVDTDIVEMSYEELLALEERIGNVEIGLSEDIIEKCLEMGKHSAFSGASSVTSHNNEVLCSICQEEFRENDDLGLLVCGHCHHPACIKQWLRLKNQCPVCKAPACLE